MLSENFLDSLEYNLRAAIQYNSIDLEEEFTVLSAILSEPHDEGEYFWVIRGNNTKYYYVLTGGYTGWDCRSSASLSDPFTDLNQLYLFIPQFDNQNRPVYDISVDNLKRHLNVENVKSDVKQIVNE